MDPARFELALSTCKADVLPVKTTGPLLPVGLEPTTYSLQNSALPLS